MTFVFQYGSNVYTARINGPDRLNGNARVVGLFRSDENYELRFEVWSKANNCATASIRRGGSNPIWGILYEVPNHLIRRDTAGSAKSLDAIEGECQTYRRDYIDVVQPDSGRSVRAVTYVAKSPQNGIQTSLKYAAYIIRGLREHSAPPEYIEHIKDVVIANNPDIAEGVNRL